MILFITRYLYWHYSRALWTLYEHVQTLLHFLWRFFAIPQLFRTLVSPWRRMQERYSTNSLQDLIGTLVVNTIMRLVGMVIRLTIILFGIAILIAAGAISLVGLILWVLLPVVVGFVIALIIRQLA